MQAILHAIGKPPERRALIVGSNVQFTAGRMAELLDPTGIKVFRDEPAALDWLFSNRSQDQPLQFDRSPSGKVATVRNR